MASLCLVTKIFVFDENKEQMQRVEVRNVVIKAVCTSSTSSFVSVPVWPDSASISVHQQAADWAQSH